MHERPGGNSPYYEPSGRIPLKLIPASLAGILATLFVACAYAWMATSLPQALTAMALLLFAAATGCAAWYIAKAAQVRHPRWMGRIGLLIGFFAWYGQWAAFLAMASHDAPAGVSAGHFMIAFLHLLASPGSMAGLIASLAGAAGHDALDIGFVVSSSFAGWFTEFALLLICPSLFGSIAAAAPYCEASHTWMETARIPGRFKYIEAAGDVRSLLETHPHDLFSILSPHLAGQSPHHALATVYRGHAQGAAFVSMHNVEVSKDKEKVAAKETPVTLFLRIPNMAADDTIRTLTRLSSHSTSAADAAAADPPELAQAIHLLESGQFEAVVDAAAPFVQAPRPDLRRDANRLCALATARLGRWNASLGYWKALFADEHTAHNALQLASTSAMAGQLDDAEQWIAEAREINTASRELPGVFMQTNFVTALCQSGQVQAALPYLDEIKQVYEQVGITDPTHLYMRKLPLFDVFLNSSAPVIRAVLSPEKGQAWYRSMLPYLDAGGQSRLNDWLEKQFLGTAG